MTISKPKSLRKIWGKATPYLLILPVVIYYAIFWVRPVIAVMIGSVTDASGAFTLQNFVMVFSDENFWPALNNTAIIVLFSVTVEFMGALFLALLINRKFWGSGIFLFLTLIPMALPAVATGAMWVTGFTAHGWINSLLYYLGILAEGDKIYWLGGLEANQFKLLALVIIIDAWQVIPSMMIILLAGLQNLPKEAKEAGYVFGGNFMTVLRKITMPMLRPTIQTAVILRLISAIQIWLIIVLLLGFGRLPILVERIVYYHEEVPGLNISDQMAAGYTIVVSLIVSLTALAYLRVSGAFKKEEAA